MVWQWLPLLLMTLSLILVFFFSWLPSPRLGEQVQMPDWLEAFCNKYDNLRTAVPMVFMGAFGAWWIEVNGAGHKWVWIFLAACTLVVVVAELGQLLLPQRSFDWLDILFGIAGTCIGLFTGGMVCRLVRKVRGNKAQHTT